MSDGRENRREKEQEQEVKSRKPEGADNYGRTIGKIAVSQICTGVGFQNFQHSALETLSDIAIRYLGDLGKTAHFYANLAGRTECNIFDIIQGLENLTSLEGSSDAISCIASSSTVKEITQYVNSVEEIPFVQPVPRFPVVRKEKPTPSFLQIGETPVGKHIPAWLPAFPDCHTYIHTPMWNERASDPRTDKIQQARQRRKAERSLLSLQQRLASNGSVEPTSLDSRRDGKAKQTVKGDPFLIPPLQFGEKDVSPVLLPNEQVVVDNQSSVLDTFAPVIEAAKNGLCDSDHSERNVVPNKRPFLHFKFGVGKKSLRPPVDLMIDNKVGGKTSPWFGRDEDKDDKKRRAEQILKESMENPHELAQL